MVKGFDENDEPPRVQPKLLPVLHSCANAKHETAREKGCSHVVGRCFRELVVHYQCWQVVSEAVARSSSFKVRRQCVSTGFFLHDGLPEMVEAISDASMPVEAANEDWSSSISD